MEASRQQRNVELVHHGLAAYNGQDFEAVVELLDEDVEVYTRAPAHQLGHLRIVSSRSSSKRLSRFS
jgi:ketosteroid isomerase-like protein